MRNFSQLASVGGRGGACSRAASSQFVLLIGLCVPLLVLLLSTGCAVPQPRGDGQLSRIVEPSTKRGYWLYLPKDYVSKKVDPRSRKWPLVVSFHGMKPFDTSRAQALEWENEADRYGFVIIAPELRAPDVLQQFPVRRVNNAFQKDIDATLAILDHVFATTAADPGNVLATSWSSGGYMAHYMLNHHPDRFTCLGVRQSNYSESILDAGLTPRSREHPVLILSTQNDFSGVKKETRKAIQWYERHNYENFAWVVIKSLGHERTPDMAAMFFAQLAGVEPNRTPSVLAQRQAIGGNPRGLALLAAKPPAAASRPPTAENPRVASTAAPTPRSPVLHARSGPAEAPGGWQVARPPGPATTAAQRAAQPPPLPRTPVAIRVSSAIGTNPLVLAFSADCPADWHRNAQFLWTLNGDPIANQVNGQKTISEPGEHTLGLLVTTRDAREYRAYRLIRVLPAIESSRYSHGATP